VGVREFAVLYPYTTVMPSSKSKPQTKAELREMLAQAGLPSSYHPNGGGAATLLSSPIRHSIAAEAALATWEA
jgi:hypothetical protein